MIITKYSLHTSRLLLLASALLLPLASSHSRWSCPEPRSPSTGIKSGPCGGDTNDFSDPLLLLTADGENNGSIVEIKPGPLRVTFEESITHRGAPFRISLSGKCERVHFGLGGRARCTDTEH